MDTEKERARDRLKGENQTGKVPEKNRGTGRRRDGCLSPRQGIGWRAEEERTDGTIRVAILPLSYFSIPIAWCLFVCVCVCVCSIWAISNCSRSPLTISHKSLVFM